MATTGDELIGYGRTARFEPQATAPANARGLSGLTVSVTRDPQH